MNGHTFWGLCTLALIVIPAVIMQGFSLRWYMLDGTSGKGLCIAHMCLLGVFLRYVAFFLALVCACAVLEMSGICFIVAFEGIK